VAFTDLRPPVKFEQIEMAEYDNILDYFSESKVPVLNASQAQKNRATSARGRTTTVGSLAEGDDDDGDEESDEDEDWEAGGATKASGSEEGEESDEEESDEDLASEVSDDDVKTAKANNKVKSPTNKPKKEAKKAKKAAAPEQSSGFRIYQGDTLKTLKEEYPDWKYADILKEVSVRWKTLSAEEKAPYVQA
jgi:hypothetical protein